MAAARTNIAKTAKPPIPFHTGIEGFVACESPIHTLLNDFPKREAAVVMPSSAVN